MSEEEEVRAACYNYFLAQQALQKVEEEKVRLENFAENLECQIRDKHKTLESLSYVKEDLQDQVNAIRYLPKGLSADETKDLIEAEKALHTTMALADGAMDEAEEDTYKTKANISETGRTTRLLEDSLLAQVRFNKILTDGLNEANERLKHEQDRISRLLASKDTLQKEIHLVKKKSNKARNTVQTRSTLKQRAQKDLQDRDFDALRMRKDNAFAKKIYLNELENAREQELFLQELLMENKRLRYMVAKVEAELPPGLLKEKEKSSSDAAVSDRSGREKDIPIETVRTMKVEGIQKAPPILEKFKDYNLNLLQQMVASMHLLQSAAVEGQGGK